MDTGAKGGNRMLKDLVKANRSYRGYDESRCVTKEELLEMADCARLAASSVNRQPLQYYLAWEKDEVDKIQALTKWAKGLPELTLPHPHMCPTAFIVICQNTKRGESLVTVPEGCRDCGSDNSACGDRDGTWRLYDWQFWRRQRQRSTFSSGVSLTDAYRGDRKAGGDGRARGRLRMARASRTTGMSRMYIMCRSGSLRMSYWIEVCSGSM